MTDLNIPALKAAAQAVPSWFGMADTPMMPTWHGDPSYGGTTHRYIALANPAAVLALIERLEKLEAVAKATKAHAAAVRQRWLDICKAMDAGWDGEIQPGDEWPDAVALRAALAALEATP